MKRSKIPLLHGISYKYSSLEQVWTKETIEKKGKEIRGRE
ncbi:hypothetical protein FH5_03535 [Priestia endophytica]|nr:hypothetical protein FH5_03535 [Priestia endophytica]